MVVEFLDSKSHGSKINPALSHEISILLYTSLVSWTLELVFEIMEDIQSIQWSGVQQIHLLDV